MGLEVQEDVHQGPWEEWCLPPFPGQSGRGRRAGDQQKRRRSDRSSVADRNATGDEGKQPAKHKAGTISTDEGGPPATEAGFPNSEQTNQGQDGSNYGGAPYTGDNDYDSESEDEAPRRSRHGEGRKRRRGMDAEDVDGGGERWDQDAEQGGQWEPSMVST